MLRISIIIVFCLMLCAVPSQGKENDAIETALLTIKQPQGKIVKERFIENIDVTEFSLSNGMKICLKPMQTDDEILITLFAHGGWLSFPVTQRASAKYAGTIALESGVDTIDASDLTKLMFKYSLDLSVRTRIYQRTIEGSCPAESMEYLLAIIHKYFSHPRYEKTGLTTVVENTIDAIHHRNRDCDAIFEDLFYSINTQKNEILNPISKSELNRITLEESHQIFKQSFSRPEEFTCIIVGNFAIEAIKPLILCYLSSIPTQQDASIEQEETIPLSFPKDIITKELSCPGNTESLTRLTFPILLDITSKTFHELDFATQIIETRLRNHLRNTIGSTQGVDVGYIFPLFPRLIPVWLTLQFRASQNLIAPITNTIITEMKALQHHGPKNKDIEIVNTLFSRINTFWNQENSYWLATLVNYYRWQWDIATLHQDKKHLKDLSLQEIHHILKQTFSIDNYTHITMH
jgi:zinc protease